MNWTNGRNWYRKLADIPGVNYPSCPKVNRSRLPWHNLKPIIHSYEFQGEIHEHLTWPYRDGESNESPASKHRPNITEYQPPQVLLQYLYEALELPGKGVDYYVAIERCIQWLWQYRREHPEALDEIEKLCWLGIRLVEAPPNITWDGIFYWPCNVTFKYLIDLYSSNGYLVEALDVAQRFERHLSKANSLIPDSRFRHTDAYTNKVRERLVNIEADNG